MSIVAKGIGIGYLMPNFIAVVDLQLWMLEVDH